MEAADSSSSYDSELTDVLEYDDIGRSEDLLTTFTPDDEDMHSATRPADHSTPTTTGARNETPQPTTDPSTVVTRRESDGYRLETQCTNRSSDVDMHSARGSIEEDINIDEHCVYSTKNVGADITVRVEHNISGDGHNSDTSLDYGSDSDHESNVCADIVGLAEESTYTSIGYFDTEEEAEKNLHRLNEFVYTYKTRYISTFRVGMEYLCRSHQDCTHSIKLIAHQAGELETRFQVLQKGLHTGAIVNLKTRGISPVMKPEIDSLLKLGMSAGRVRNMMMFKYLRDPSMLALIPETKKMENRKAHLKKQAGEGWEISKFVTMRSWTCSRLCQNREEFFRVDENNAAEMNAMIVLDEFEHSVVVNGISMPCVGMVVTSRALFQNIRRAVRDQDGTVVLSTDGTYRIHFGGWTLVDCGGISIETTGPSYVQRFRPLLYMFVRTESTQAYERMFCGLVKYTKMFFDVDVDIRSASIDHSDAIASALEIVWPNVEILTCYEHLLRQCRKQTRLEKRKGYIKDVAMPHIRLLHISRSLKQFRALSQRVISSWKGDGEYELASWFQNVYLTPRWERWSVNSSSIPGFLPTQQPIESHHRVIKVIVTDYKKAPTITVLNSVLPRVLLYDLTNLAVDQHRHFAEGPLNGAAVMKAKDKLILPTNHRITRTKSRGRTRIFFNSENTMMLPVSTSNLAAVKVTAERTKVFKQSLSGNLGQVESITEAEVTFLSLQQVIVDDQQIDKMNPLILRAKWSCEDIQAVRNALRCTCKSYKHTGWVCAHTIASLHLLEKLKIGLAMASVPMRGLPGRPRALVGALQRESDMYDVDRLIELFKTNPGRPLKWPVVQEFDVSDENKTFKEHRVGQVAGCRLSETEGVYIWSVTLIHGDSLEYQVEELAHAVRRAYALGTQ